MDIVNKKLKELKPAEYNPRKISNKELQDLENSLEKFGYIEPIIWNERTGNVVGGHQRLKILNKKMKPDEEVQVVKVNFDEFQEKSLNIALNKIRGDFENTKLIELLENIRNNNKDALKYTGFGEVEIDKLLKLKAKEQPMPESVKYDIHLEDLYELDNGTGLKHYVMCGDATNKEDMIKLLKGTKIDLVVTDPPYNVDYDQDKSPSGTPINSNGKIKNDNMSDEEFKLFLDKFMSNILTFENCSYYIFMSCKEWSNVMRSFQKYGGHWSSTIIWNKSTFVMGRQDYHRKFEPILYGWREGDKHIWNGGRNQNDVWDIDKPLKNDIHPTMKPIDLCIRAIKNNTEKYGKVYDCFGGSGSTLIACEQAERNCYMMELDEDYCSKIIERWESLTGCKAKKISSYESNSPSEIKAIQNIEPKKPEALPDY